MLQACLHQGKLHCICRFFEGKEAARGQAAATSAPPQAVAKALTEALGPPGRCLLLLELRLGLGWEADEEAKAVKDRDTLSKGAGERERELDIE